MLVYGVEWLEVFIVFVGFFCVVFFVFGCVFVELGGGEISDWEEFGFFVGIEVVLVVEVDCESWDFEEWFIDFDEFGDNIVFFLDKNLFCNV